MCKNKREKSRVNCDSRHQDVDIEDQIRNAQFMYPERPWKTISKEAVSCIQHFLVVQHDARYTVDQALNDKWIRDAQCLSDITKLEEEAKNKESCKIKNLSNINSG